MTILTLAVSLIALVLSGYALYTRRPSRQAALSAPITPPVDPTAPRYRLAAYDATGAELAPVYVGDDGAEMAKRWRALDGTAPAARYHFLDRGRVRGRYQPKT